MSAGEVFPEGLRHPKFIDFDVAQLRSIVFAYRKSPEDIPRSRSELLQLLESLQSDDLRLLLAKLELTQAYKHTYLYRIGEVASRKVTSELLAEWFAKCKEKRVGVTSLYPLNYHLGEYFSIRLVQPIVSHVFESIPGGLYRLSPILNRHAVVISIKPAVGIVEVRFDGFEQSKHTPTETKHDYPTIAEDCRLIVESILQQPVEGLNLRNSIEALLLNYSNEVAQFGIKSRFKQGNITIDTDESSGVDLKAYLADAFPGVNPIDVASPWTNKHMLLAWPQLKMATRVNFGGETSDILFLWRRGSSKTLSSTDKIIKRLVENSETWVGDARRRLEREFQRLLSWGLITPADVAQAGGVNVAAALEFLLEKTVEGVADLRYRYHTKELLADSDNAWVSSIGELPSSVETISGVILDLANPKNIEVGFEVGGKV